MESEVIMRKGSRKQKNQRKPQSFDIGGGDISAIPGYESEAYLEGIDKVRRN